MRRESNGRASSDRRPRREDDAGRRPGRDDGDSQQPRRDEGSDRQSRRGVGTGRRRFLRAAGAATATGLAGCLTGGGDAGGLTIGAVYPLTGALAEIGQPVADFFRNAVDEVVNRERPDLDPLVLAGGAGLPDLGEVEYVVADHRTDPATARAEAERLVQEEGADLLFGAYNSAASKTASQAAERLGVPMVSAVSTSPELTERGLEWYYRITPHDGTSATNMFQFFDGLNGRGIDLGTVGLIHESSEFGSTGAEAMAAAADEFGYDVVAGPVSYEADAVASLDGQVADIAAADPDVLMAMGYLRDSLLLMEGLRKHDWTPKVVMGNDAGFSQPKFKRRSGLTAYTMTRAVFTDDIARVHPEIGRYNEFVKETVGQPFFGEYLRTWGGVVATCKAAAEAGSTDPAALRDALDGLDLDPIVDGLPYGVRFDGNNQNERAFTYMAQYREERSRLVWPFEDATTEATVPMPDWEDR